MAGRRTERCAPCLKAMQLDLCLLLQLLQQPSSVCAWVCVYEFTQE